MKANWEVIVNGRTIVYTENKDLAWKTFGFYIDNAKTLNVREADLACVEAEYWFTYRAED